MFETVDRGMRLRWSVELEGGELLAEHDDVAIVILANDPARRAVANPQMASVSFYYLSSELRDNRDVDELHQLPCHGVLDIVFCRRAEVGIGEGSSVWRQGETVVGDRPVAVEPHEVV